MSGDHNTKSNDDERLLNAELQTGKPRLGWECESEIASEPLYKAPQPRRRLSDEEIKATAMEAFDSYWDADDETLVNKYGHGIYLHRFVYFARAIERAHGIGGQK